jgi:hypothetical protein
MTLLPRPFVLLKSSAPAESALALFLARDSHLATLAKYFRLFLLRKCKHATFGTWDAEVPKKFKLSARHYDMFCVHAHAIANHDENEIRAGLGAQRPDAFGRLE